ncbi:ATP synthase F1 subcomplex delta subunit [Flavobacterium fryxellicola]|jgi:F-type H+-transporting ATPase subunit delta|uniref:ATP synthase subunit delta n=1 Tax=Flavobacterium fryxellicola TaxID=249352 RepID=A0A168AI73_9FLAO|nr:ATP synthase F1 subunit delta [Flavobacterium fryxellicola]OAB31496.1 F0F1 ATP synthase subunit delta [Flavobacterium fryxellicola]SHN53284.1 ATP synthase F1 subcomplex delta subunit [Flavobacterium fryxellicola]
MSGTRAAIRYAKAFLDLAISEGNEPDFYKDMALISSTINSNEELSGFIQNPTISVSVKQSALAEVFASTTALTKSLFRLLFENKRFEILSDIVSQYIVMSDENNGFQVVKVTTAIAMDAALEAKVSAKIKEFSDKKITIVNTIDPAIIGGFILRIGDKEYNASVANRLQVLKRELSN